LSGCFDVLDGTVARVTESETSFGAFLDSFLDRYSEGALLIGVVYWATCHGHHGLVILVFLTMLGSLMVSYARARAEGLGFSCKVGMFSRLERMIVLSATLLTGYLFIGFAALGFLTHATAFQRFFHVYKKTRA
jgi:CDP-diacylglycerol--glycerol-3-phosphate 3-phosphatidyltransferase